MSSSLGVLKEGVEWQWMGDPLPRKSGVRSSVSVFLDLEMLSDDEDDAEEEELELEVSMGFVNDELRR